MRPAALLLSFGCLVGSSVATVDARAQVRDPVGRSWPASWDASSGDGVGAVQRQERLPVYDDAGGLITRDEIAARVDPSGGSGAFWGLLLGVSTGALIGAAIYRPDCGDVRGNMRIHCSPREDALNSSIRSGFTLVLGALGLWGGWEDDQTTWDEALQQIRRERAEGR